jgi:hypothetical protein
MPPYWLATLALVLAFLIVRAQPIPWPDPLVLAGAKVPLNNALSF